MDRYILFYFTFNSDLPYFLFLHIVCTFFSLTILLAVQNSTSLLELIEQASLHCLMIHAQADAVTFN